MIMKLLLLCISALCMGLPHTASGSTSTTDMPTTHPIASTTDFKSNPAVKRIGQIIETSNIKDCGDRQRDVCTRKLGKMTQFNRENFCRYLKMFSQCIDKCDQPLKDGVNEGLKELSCGGCRFLQGSLLALIMAAFLRYFV